MPQPDERSVSFVTCEVRVGFSITTEKIFEYTKIKSTYR